MDPSRTATIDLIQTGESTRVEFKQTSRINVHTKQRDPVIEQMVVRAVAGFMNAEGGTLLIGVKDNRDVSGIDMDLSTLGKRQTRDGFALWLNGLLDSALGPTATSNVRISFEELSGSTLCRVDVTPGREPTLARGAKGEADLYVRLNNATRLLNTAEALAYVRSRWR